MGPLISNESSQSQYVPVKLHLRKNIYVFLQSCDTCVCVMLGLFMQIARLIIQTVVFLVTNILDTGSPANIRWNLAELKLFFSGRWDIM